MELKEAIQLVLELAEQNALSHDEADTHELMHEQERQEQAIAMVRALHDPGKTSTPTPATREYNVMLRRSCFEYVSVGMAGISAQNVVDTIREHLEDSSFTGNLPWERDTEKSEPVDWISAEGELELGERGGNDGRSIDHAEWEQPKPASGKLMEALIAIRRLSSADSDNLAMLQDALSAIADVANKIVIDHVEGEAGKS